MSRHSARSRASCPSFHGRLLPSAAPPCPPTSPPGPAPPANVLRFPKDAPVLQHQQRRYRAGCPTLELAAPHQRRPWMGKLGADTRTTMSSRMPDEIQFICAPAERPNHSFLLYASYEAFCGIFRHYSPNDQLHQSSCSVTKVSDLSAHRSRAGTPSLLCKSVRHER